MIKFFVNGIETPVIIDDYFPVYHGTNQLVFARSGNETELWVSLYEKAWAKLHGSYAAISGGSPDFTVNHLLGTPVKSLFHREFPDLSNLW